MCLVEIGDELTHRLGTLEDDHLASTTQTATTISTLFRRRAGKELALNSTVAWKNSFMRNLSNRESYETQEAVDWDDPDDPGVILHQRADDMRRLWAHPTVHAILERQGIRLQELPGLYVLIFRYACVGLIVNSVFWMSWML